MTRVADLAVFLDRRRLLAVDEVIGVVAEPAALGLPDRVPPVLRAAAEVLRPGFSHSATEGQARQIIVEEARALGLRAEPRPHKIVGASGRVVAEADVAVVALKVDLEIDGPHHDAPSQRAADARRDRRAGAVGWVVLRYPVREIEQDWDAFRRRVRADLARMVALRRSA